MGPWEDNSGGSSGGFWEGLLSGVVSGAGAYFTNKTNKDSDAKIAGFNAEAVAGVVKFVSIAALVVFVFKKIFK